MKKQVIIVAGGLGKRLNAEVPKQFIEINGKTVIEYTVEAFLRYHRDICIVLVVHPDFMDLAQGLFPNKNITFIEGGKERFHSVKKGIEGLKDTDSIIAIHDAARPLVSVDTIKKCFDCAEENGTAIPVVDVKESLRMIKGSKNQSVDRRWYKSVQTPQCFRFSILKNAYQQEFTDAFTDDASVVEKMGESIHLVEGNSENIKITTPTDLYVAAHQLNIENKSF